MEKILIVIAICEVVRTLQNAMEFVERMLKEYEEQEDADAAD